MLRPLRSAVDRTPAACFRMNKKQREREINSQAEAGDAPSNNHPHLPPST
jgi:hypothetical protein